MMTDHLSADEKSSMGLPDDLEQKSKIREYDFRHPKLVSKEIMRALHKIHNLFARNIKRVFANVLNLQIEVTLEDIEQVIFAEFISGLETPTAIFLFNIEELGEWAVLQMDPAFCVFFVEHQSGGRLVQLGEKRKLTRIEERIMGRTIDKLFKELTHIWSPYTSMTIIHHVYESKPANIRTISSLIPGIAVTFQLKVEKLQVPFRVCYPYTLLKERMMSSFGEFSNAGKKEALSTQERTQFKNEMKHVQVMTQAMLGTTKISIEKLLELREGDLIRLDQRIDDPLDIHINDKLKMQGYPGKKSGKKAIKIFNILENKNQYENL